jgi:predicted transglutaminase-like protease
MKKVATITMLVIAIIINLLNIDYDVNLLSTPNTVLVVNAAAYIILIAYILKSRMPSGR